MGKNDKAARCISCQSPKKRREKAWEKVGKEEALKKSLPIPLDHDEYANDDAIINFGIKS